MTMARKNKKMQHDFLELSTRSASQVWSELEAAMKGAVVEGSIRAERFRSAANNNDFVIRFTWEEYEAENHLAHNPSYAIPI